MKNIIGESPFDKPYGRSHFSLLFLRDKDVTNKNILDIGCGYGWFEHNTLLRKPKEIQAMEISANDLATAKKNISNSKISFIIGRTTKIPAPNEYFDTVVMWEVLEHLPKNSEQKAFYEINRVLKKGGSFYLSTPYNSFLSTLFDPAYWLIGHRHYSLRKILRFAKKAGFRKRESIVKGKGWCLINIFNLYLSKWIFRRKPFFGGFFMDKENKEYSAGQGFMNIFVRFVKEKSYKPPIY